MDWVSSVLLLLLLYYRWKYNTLAKATNSSFIIAFLSLLKSTYTHCSMNHVTAAIFSRFDCTLRAEQHSSSDTAEPNITILYTIVPKNK